MWNTVETSGLTPRWTGKPSASPLSARLGAKVIWKPAFVLSAHTKLNSLTWACKSRLHLIGTRTWQQNELGVKCRTVARTHTRRELERGLALAARTSAPASLPAEAPLSPGTGGLDGSLPQSTAATHRCSPPATSAERSPRCLGKAGGHARPRPRRGRRGPGGRAAGPRAGVRGAGAGGAARPSPAPRRSPARLGSAAVAAPVPPTTPRTLCRRLPAGGRSAMSSPKNGFYRQDITKTLWEVPDRYRDLQPVGSGAYGAVWWAGRGRAGQGSAGRGRWGAAMASARAGGTLPSPPRPGPLSRCSLPTFSGCCAWPGLALPGAACPAVAEGGSPAAHLAAPEPGGGRRAVPPGEPGPSRHSSVPRSVPREFSSPEQAEPGAQPQPCSGRTDQDPDPSRGVRLTRSSSVSKTRGVDLWDETPVLGLWCWCFGGFCGIRGQGLFLLLSRCSSLKLLKIGSFSSQVLAAF